MLDSRTELGQVPRIMRLVLPEVVPKPVLNPETFPMIQRTHRPHGHLHVTRLKWRADCFDRNFPTRRKRELHLEASSLPRSC